MSLRDQIMTHLPDAGHLNACFTCGICASGCPASGLADMDPRKFVRLLSMEMDEQILSNNWVWMCTTCNRCLYVCPMKIDIPQLVFLVRSHWPKNDRPKGIVDYCQQSKSQNSGSVQRISNTLFESIIKENVERAKKSEDRFEQLNAPIDKKGATFFLTQSSDMVTREPNEMASLWKILHLVNANWTYGSKGWAAENYCMFLADDAAWENLVSKKAEAAKALGCKVLLNTECGHDYFAIKEGLEKFRISQPFEVKSIIEYYAQWIREGKLNVNSDWNLDLKIKFTVQDPCQLVRKSYGDFIAEQLRFVIKEAVGEENFIDMSPNCSNNYCCGGGGGAIRTAFNQERLSYGKVKLDQVLETGAAYCITPCNNCHSQIKELSQHYQADIGVLHLWTVLGLSLDILDKTEREILGSDLAMVGLQSGRLNKNENIF